ncbi:MAG: NUDIX domain-containing protein [Bacteroidetes bacterium]|nr:NUDIX domain-containing protein [Bacteroidota bacterium]
MEVLKCKTFFGEEKAFPKEKFKFRPSVYAIIIKDDNLLTVTSKRTNTLMLPGGGIDIGEPIETALIREVNEETGIEIEILKFINFKDSLFYYDPLDEAFHSFLFYYHCRALTDQLKADSEVVDYECSSPKWVPLDTLKPELFNNFGEEVLKTVNIVVNQ